MIRPDTKTAPGSDNWPPTDGLALATPYELDPFQKHAVLGIHAGHHVFVAAKTGSGKTFVGEYLCARALAAGGRVFYTTPIKSLSNQKYHDLKRLFPAASVGILTGDIKMCPDAQIVVMTAEILRNLFFKRGTATERVGLSAAVSLEGVVGVVMDEVHYIQDPDRGHVWEETLILCPRELQLVMLSATMPSAESLVSWLSALHGRQVMLLETAYRVVPLVHGVMRRAAVTGGGGSSLALAPYMDAAGSWHGDAYRGLLDDREGVADAVAAHQRAVRARGAGDPSVRRSAAAAAHESPMARLRRTVAWLRSTDQLPALFFVFSRRECERLAVEMEGSFLEPADSAAAGRIVDFHLSRHRAILERSPQYHAVRDLALRGVAFHHSGLQPLLKEIVELLFARGLVRLLFATETFAVGLNMPTRTVVFLDLRKFSDGGEQRLLRPDEYIQMAGRAGRRGKDTRGLVLYEPLREPVEPEELRAMVCGALPALESRMRFHYDFLMRRRLPGADGPVGSIAEQSYWAAQQREARAALEALAAETRAAATAATEKVTAAERAEWAVWRELTVALEGAKGAARRRAQTALDEWLEAGGRRGARWDGLRGRMRAATEAETRLERLLGRAAAWDAAPLLAVEPLEHCLTEWGFFWPDGALTPLGVAATEVNEGHPLLMPLLAASGRTGELTAEELACVLAAFIREGGGGRDGEGPGLGDAGLGSAAMDTLHWLDAQVGRCQRDEERAGVRDGPADFWQLSALWVCVAARWVAGAGLTEIASEFGLFEGNVQRGLLRVANLLEEWAAICELRADLEGLERVRGLRFLRDEIVVDSLYLRL